jgi:hypothetical protein
MKPNKLQCLITHCLEDFYQHRMQRLGTLRLRQVLRRKSPYLYKAIGTQSANEVVEGILSAYLSSSDEGIFGATFFEPVAKAVSGGVVSPAEGVDIAIETPTKYLAVSVKSGPNPFNSSQKKRQNDEFLVLRSRLMKLKKQFDAMLGHCYGRLRSEPSKVQIYRDRSGQEFWTELTGDKDFYQKLIRLMREDLITRHREEYRTAWQQAVNRYVREFTNDFCDENGAIDWERLLQFNSGET